MKNVPVPTIEKQTEDFRNRQDALNKFITQMIVKSPDAEAIGLSSLATRYIEWYHGNVKKTELTQLDIQTQFENSRIASSIERRSAGIFFLTKHRLKAHPEEPLEPNEELLVSIYDDTPARAEVVLDDLNII